MRLTSTLCAAIVTLAAFALAADGAFAAINLNSSKSNIYKAIDPKDPKAVQACKDGGGTVGKDPKGHDACITPAPATPATPQGN
jgi:hypothetical protein